MPYLKSKQITLERICHNDDPNTIFLEIFFCHVNSDQLSDSSPCV